MSELTQCCRCSLDAIEKRARAGDDKVTRVKAPIDGFPDGEDIFVNGEWSGWMGKISDNCAC